jgi:RNA-dependent RNA polymerase
MEKKYKPKEQIYVSTKILGQLYDKVESVDFVPNYEAPFDERILSAYPCENDVMKTVRQLKTKYDTAVRRLMAQLEIKNEFEIWSTFVLSKPRVGTDYKMQEDMANISDALKDRFRNVCIEAAGGKESQQLRPFVAAMYRVTHEEMQIALRECRDKKTIGGKDVPKRKMEPKYMPLISFPWLFHDILGRIATGEERENLEKLGFSYVSTTIEPKKARMTNFGKEEFDSDDFVETTEGIIHRGELLDVFAPDDADSGGDEVEQPYQGRSIKTPTFGESSGDDILRVGDNLQDILSDLETLDAPANVATPLSMTSQAGSLNTGGISEAFSTMVKTRTFSPSTAELACLASTIDLLEMEARPTDPVDGTMPTKLSGGETIFSSDSSSINQSVGEQTNEEVKEYEEVEEIIQEQESALGKLARITGY